MPRKATNLFSTARGRVRASMNKYNLFNLYKKTPVRYQGKSLFQQKWLAKQETRAYHGEHLTESRWKSLFNPNLESVAQLDASLKGVSVAPTPFSLQTYAELEKRLEFALFRAMFASSVRQAREFIKNGHVTVNGAVVKHLSFPLTSGDVFAVNPEKVLLAMGRVKPSVEQAVKTDTRQIAAWNKYVAAVRRNPKDVWDLKQAKPELLNTLQNTKASQKEQVNDYNTLVEKKMLAAQRATTRESVLDRILSAAGNKEVEELDTAAFDSLFGQKNAPKCLAAYRYLKEAGHALVASHSVEKCQLYISTKSTEFPSKESSKTAAHVKKLLSEIVSSHVEHLRVSASRDKLPEDISSVPFSTNFGRNLKPHAPLQKDAILEDETASQVKLPWQKGLFGRSEPQKPYFTPWTPRPFVGAFAVLPHHIEVSFETCHAVYLNDPVARPGHSEVISPFPDHVHERAYMYYVRKGL